MPTEILGQLDQRTTLLHLLATLSYKLGDFKLASGQRSDFYIDCRITTLHAEGGRLAGILLYDLIREHLPAALAIGGLTMGADPLVSNIASASAWAAADYAEIASLSDQLELPEDDPMRELPAEAPTLIHGFLVRKAEKAHGTGRRIEGFTAVGAPVVIVDDVCTTGNSTVNAIEATRAAGMRVIGVLCLVDREAGGRQAIEAASDGAPFFTLFTAAEVRRTHIELHSAQPDA